MNTTIYIRRQETFTRGVRCPFRWIYRLESSSGSLKANYEGTPLCSIRVLAKRLARDQRAEVVEDFEVQS